MLIREIILENFMSYEYARIPISSGLNIVCGPNGAGKSSILLAISVALGQTYTERGRKLSDLIRWGEDTARVTIVFDNKPKSNERPIPKFDTDYLRLSRYLKKDGNYWFQANFQTITKVEVVELLSNLGINPDNMLIIMHQHMMTEFGVTTNQQKLMMVEEAVGFREYREKVLEAQEKLTRVLSEEESVSNLLKNAEQTLAYWKAEYDRYQEKKELLLKKNFLERELSWAQLIKGETAVNSWNEKARMKNEELTKITEKLDRTKTTINGLKDNLDTLRKQWKNLYYSILTLEKDRARSEATTNLLNQTLTGMKSFEDALSSKLKELLSPSEETDITRDLRKEVNEQIQDLGRYIDELEKIVQRDRHDLQEIERRRTKLETQLEELKKLEDSLDMLENEREPLLQLNKKQVELGKKLEGIIFEAAKAQNEIENQKMKIERISKLAECPVCLQIIPEEHKDKIERETNENLTKLDSEYDLLNTNRTQIQSKIEDTEKKIELALLADKRYAETAAQIKMLEGVRDEIREVDAEIQQIKNSQMKLESQEETQLEEKTLDTKELAEIENKINLATDQFLNERISEALFVFHKERVESEAAEVERELKVAQRELDQLQPLADKAGTRIETSRSPLDISADIKVMDVHLSSLKEVSEDVENMYTNYLSLCNQLRDKAAIVSENRERALQEVKERENVWRNLLQSLLDDVNPTFQAFLERINATGLVRLVDTQDIEAAGLELIVGFKGADPQMLDARTQSGGERSSATMAFLLALQRHVKSQFRAVDEFDVHMDPRNREIISEMLLKEIVGDEGSQYLTITPGQITTVGEGVHVITVQNIKGRSEIKVVA